jgi:hypothetical protein
MSEAEKSVLEAKFPHIAEKVVLLWGYPELDKFFDKLAIDTRGDRAGFPADVMSDLMLLSAVHNIAYPFRKGEPKYANRGGYDFFRS